MMPTPKSPERERVEACLHQGIKALQAALSDAHVFDHVVADTVLVERNLQYALDMIRGVCIECHQAKGETIHLPLPFLRPSHN